ncbi:hypothetical protein [Lacrimispora sp.]|jgi:hypothetical protein|uniref:hypothetical protein n=1 Tax=Lacrimispora sp. TaxID=2719234 RepID=UPI00289C00B2|nr:hypothetical protein [Lacrimispora sp.]
MEKQFFGFCPAQGADYGITVEYINKTSLSDTRPVYEMGLATCRYNMFGDKCNANDCPILSKVPRTL